MMFLNVDLLGLTPIYMEHLDSWSEFMHHSPEHQFVRRCLERYERFWLPMLASCDVDVEPPDDVHWLWYLHMLKPCEYAVYCKRRFNCVLPHKFRRSKMEIKSMKSISKQVWRILHPGEPYEVDIQQLLTSNNSSYSSNLDYLIPTARSESDFAHRSDLPHFRDQAFQLTAVRRYKQYLFLKQQCPHWSPCRLPTDIELVWRVHLMHPSQYISDILRIIDDNKNQTDFTTYSLDQNLIHPPKLLFPNLIHDNQFWSYFFPDDEHQFHLNGSINRQSYTFEQTKHTLTDFSSISFEQESIEECLLRFEGLSITDLWSRRKNIKVIASLLGSNSFQQQDIFHVKEEGEWTFKSSEKKLLKFEKKGNFGECKFVRGENRGVEIDVYVSGGLFSRYKKVTKKIFDPLHHLSASQYNQHNHPSHPQSTVRVCQEVSLPKVTYTDPNITINYVVEFPERKPFNFVLDRNHAEPLEVPDYLKQYLWNVLAWQAAINDSDELNKFMVARHSVKCREHGMAFGVEVVRNDRYNLNAILLFHNNVHLVAAAFSIDSGYLPAPSQVMETCELTFDPDKGDVAMMLQKADGQDYIIIASFKDESQKADRTIIFTTYNTASKRCERMQGSADEMHTLSNNTTSVDLPSGRIVVRDRPKLVPDHIAWAFSMGCLFLSVQAWNNVEVGARQDGISSIFSGSMRSLSTRVSDVGTEDSVSVGKNRSKERVSLIKMRKNRRQIKKRKMSASFTFLLACGLRFDSVYSASNRHTLNGSTSLSNNPSIISSNTYVQI